MPRRRAKKNPLPKAPPKRRFAGQPSASPRELQSSLARVRGFAAEHERTERPFDPSRAPSWRGSSRDLVVNGRHDGKPGGDARLSPGYAYEGPDVPNKDLINVPNDDWDTVMISESDADDARFVQYLTIDDARCSVFERKSPPYGYLAQMTHMTRNGDVDPRDIPAHLHVAEINEEPESNGQDIGYSQGYSSKKEPGWYQVEYATGSDYSGGSVNESNYRVLAEMLDEHHPEDAQPVVWARTSGGHGTYGIMVRYGDLEEEAREAIDALEDYPLMNEEDHSELEMEQQSKAWDNWAQSDFIKECGKALGIDPYELKEKAEEASVDWYDVFRIAEEKANVYWEDQQGAGQWIDVKRVADVATDFLSGTKFPSYVTVEQVEAYDKLGKIVEELQANEED